MANVLPITAQKKLWRMYRAHFIVALSGSLIVLALLTALLLVPSYLALRLAAPPVVASDKVQAPADRGADTIELARAQALLRALDPLLMATSSVVADISQALSERPAGVSIDHITYTADNRQLTLSGTAAREKLNAYRDMLAGHERFSSVSVPVSALVGTGGGHFAITIILAQ